MARRRFAGRLAVIGLIGSMAVAQTGCGFLFSHGPPVGHEQMDYFTCTEGNAGPIIDVIWGSLNLVSAIAIAADPGAYFYYDNTNAAIASGLVWTVVSSAAAGVGFNKSKKCREAKRQWADRQVLNRAQMPGPRLGAVQAVVIRPHADTLAVGDRVQLVATAHASSGDALPGSRFSWSSSNQGVAAVNAAGLVTATAPGTTVVSATADDVSGTATIVVTPR